METLNSAAWFLGVVGTICAIVFGYAAFHRNQNSDVKEDAKSDATVLVELGHLRSTTERIEGKQDQLAEKVEKQNLEVMVRLAAVEASSKQAHHRIDRIEGKVDREEG